MTHHTISGHNDLPKVILSAADGAQAEIFLQGAHVTRWRLPDGGERLYLSPAAEYRPGAAIRGGVPIIFPQFAGRGPLPKHGFARSLPWTFAGATAQAGTATARFRLSADDATQRIWPHDFQAELSVTVGGSDLALTLTIVNRGEIPCSFTAALHTYLAVTDLAHASVTGLHGVRYADSTAGGVESVDASPAVIFGREVDRIYFDAPQDLRLALGDSRATLVRSAGFPDAVVWNPGPVKGAALADLEPEGYRRFVCVEAAVVGQPVLLAAGERWQGAQTLSAA